MVSGRGLNCMYVQTEIPSEDRRKEHQAQLKRQINEEAKVGGRREEEVRRRDDRIRTNVGRLREESA